MRPVPTSRRSKPRALRVRRASLLLAVTAGALALHCGEEPFEPCGGDLRGEWNLVSSALEGVTDPGCNASDTGLSGFLYFKDEGRYTLNAHVTAWKRSPSDPACGFSTADAGYWTTDGASVCIAGTKAEVDRAACDGKVEVLGAGLRGAAEYCAAQNRLRIRSRTMLGLRFPAVLELTRR